MSADYVYLVYRNDRIYKCFKKVEDASRCVDELRKRYENTELMKIYFDKVLVE